MDKSILNGNKLIAKFEYDKLCENLDSNEDCLVRDEDSGYIDFYITDSLYHNSWDWLMPVVEKIESLKSPVYIHSNCCTIYEKVDFNTDNGDLFIQSYHKTKINAVYNAVIDYIEWYNKQNNK